MDPWRGFWLAVVLGILFWVLAVAVVTCAVTDCLH